ncbi:MAG: hypothetical protein ACT4P6_05640 [Gemmatimonadaceae bacterium]
MLNPSRARTPTSSTGRFATVFLIGASLACGRGTDRAANDTGAARDSLRTDTVIAVPPFREWTATAGRYLIVAAGSADSAIVVFPEFTSDSSLAGAPLAISGAARREYDLFAPDGAMTLGRLTGLTTRSPAGCDAWPHGVIASLGELRPWTVGLSTGRARGIPYLALDQLPARDSAGLVVNLTRLASQAPHDSSTTFRGLPYVVRSAFTATLADSQLFLFGELVRRLNIEAKPHEERITVIGERPTATPDAPYTLAFSERHVGDEESVPTTELIGLVVLRDGTHAAFAARDYSDGGTFLMFVPDEAGRWRLRWQSAYAGC